VGAGVWAGTGAGVAGCPPEGACAPAGPTTGDRARTPKIANPKTRLTNPLIREVHHRSFIELENRAPYSIGCPGNSVRPTALTRMSDASPVG
jgi:hypothetical protein